MILVEQAQFANGTVLLRVLPRAGRRRRGEEPRLSGAFVRSRLADSKPYLLRARAEPLWIQSKVERLYRTAVAP